MIDRPSGNSLHCCGHDLVLPHLFSVEIVGMVHIVNSPGDDSDTLLCLHNMFIGLIFSLQTDLQIFPGGLIVSIVSDVTAAPYHC